LEGRGTTVLGLVVVHARSFRDFPSLQDDVKRNDRRHPEESRVHIIAS